MSLASLLNATEAQIQASQKRILPDVAQHQRLDFAGALDWVGMSELEVPVLWKGAGGELWHIPARAKAFVNLIDPGAKGIHMSRLFLQLQQLLAQGPLTPPCLIEILKGFLESHQGISDASFLSLKFDFMVERPALKSGYKGWRSYPIEVKGVHRAGEVALEVGFQVTYSSTCPCSAALARQLIQEQFQHDFADQGERVSFEQVFAWLGSEQGIVATPHSQRSEADVKVLMSAEMLEFPFIELIDRVEGALKTSVQAAVKREDEQEFARLNGQNPMFCEDAARIIFKALNEDPKILDFWARATHIESLHPHNAVSIVTKGIADGFKN